jgi:hypothetical protein
VTLEKHPLRVARDWSVGFGPLLVYPDETRTVEIQPQVIFSGQKIVSSDANHIGPGRRPSGLLVVSLSIDSKEQRLPSPCRTTHFDREREFALDICTAEAKIVLVVKNDRKKPQKLDISILGKAIF